MGSVAVREMILSSQADVSFRAVSLFGSLYSKETCLAWRTRQMDPSFSASCFLGKGCCHVGSGVL